MDHRALNHGTIYGKEMNKQISTVVKQWNSLVEVNEGLYRPKCTTWAGTSLHLLLLKSSMDKRVGNVVMNVLHNVLVCHKYNSYPLGLLLNRCKPKSYSVIRYDRRTAGIKVSLNHFFCKCWCHTVQLYFDTLLLYYDYNGSFCRTI